LKKLTDTEVKYVINTHVHNDHTGGNKYFKESATIIAHIKYLKMTRWSFYKNID